MNTIAWVGLVVVFYALGASFFLVFCITRFYSIWEDKEQRLEWLRERVHELEKQLDEREEEEDVAEPAGVANGVD